MDELLNTCLSQQTHQKESSERERGTENGDIGQVRLLPQKVNFTHEL